MKKIKEMTIHDLPGVGAATAEKLKDAGFDTLLSIAVATPGELTEASGVGESVARKIINTARSEMDMGFESGEDLLKKRESVIRISTGSKEFDRLVGGGFESGAITECYGAFGSSKTQIAHTLAVNVQLPIEQGGVEGQALWIDTENTFRPERIKEIAESKGLDAEKLLKNIKVARAYNSDHQMLLAEKAIEIMNEEGNNIKLVIIDSLMSHFRSEFIGRGTLSDRQQKLNKHMHVLMKLADTKGSVVYITNQVMAKPDTFFGDPTAPIGGNIVAHASTFRLYLRRGKKGTRVAKLVDSPNLADGEAIYKVTEGGVVDI